MYYQINRETQKLELIFSKEEYQALPEEKKREIKSAFLFSRYIGGWVSRAKFPHLYAAERVAQSLGAEDRGKTGEALSFAEQQERKAERAEARAERMEARASAAEKRGEALQKPISDMHGDIAFFTQPNINSSAGRAFTRRREKMWAAYDRGFEEFKKSAYYVERAEAARTTAEWTKPQDKGFCERRIADAQKTIRAQRKNLETYAARLAKIDVGETVTGWNGEPIPRETVERWIEDAEEIIDNAVSKEIYYRDCLEELGGIQFSRENVKPGYLVELPRWGVQRVVSVGPKNFTYRSLNPSNPIVLKASYGEIIRVVKAEEAAPEAHPFKVGDKFTVTLWNGHDMEKTPCEIVKSTDKSVTVLNTLTGKKLVRRPKRHQGVCYPLGYAWSIFLDDNYSSGYHIIPGKEET